MAARVHSRAARGVVTQGRFDRLGERFGASDVRRHDVRDPADEQQVIGQRQYLFVDRDGLEVDVTVTLTDDGFTASVETACP